MTSAASSEDLPALEIPLELVGRLFEPWDDLDSALEQLQAAIKTDADVRETVAAVIAAREALRVPLYAVLRAYQSIRAEEREAGDAARPLVQA